MKIGISACLAGHKVRYDGTDKRNEELLSLLQGHEILCLCPEADASFPVPHLPLEQRQGRVFTAKDQDVTDKLAKGCHICFEKVKDCDFLILKSKSPSCGKGRIYDGTFSGKLIEGDGLFTKLCVQNNMKIFSEEEIEAIRKELI